jgi:hypothetical protein
MGGHRFRFPGIIFARYREDGEAEEDLEYRKQEPEPGVDNHGTHTI